MKTIKTALGTAIGFLMVLAFTGTITAIVVSLALPDKTILRNVWEELRCIAGYPEAGSDCVLDAIGRAQDAVAAANQRRAEAEAAQRAAEDALARGDLEFIQGPAMKDGVSLVVGTIYLDVTNRTGLVRSFCWAVVDNPGLDPRVGLAVRDASGQITVLPLTTDDLTLLDTDAAEASAALVSCPWPGGTT